MNEGSAFYELTMRLQTGINHLMPSILPDLVYGLHARRKNIDPCYQVCFLH